MAVPSEPFQIRFTLAQLLAAISACCGILIGYRLFGFLGASTAGSCTGAALFVWGRRAKQPGLTIAGITLAIPSAGIVGLAILGRTFLHIGPVYYVEDWPWAFKEMVTVASADTTDAKLYHQGGFIDSAHVWRLSLSAEQTQRVVEQLDWRSLPASQIPAEFRQAFPIWWRPTATPSCQFYGTPGFPIGTRGPDGEYYLAMYDPQTLRLYVWYKLNF